MKNKNQIPSRPIVYIDNHRFMKYHRYKKKIFPRVIHYTPHTHKSKIVHWRFIKNEKKKKKKNSNIFAGRRYTSTIVVFHEISFVLKNKKKKFIQWSIFTDSLNEGGEKKEEKKKTISGW